MAKVVVMGAGLGGVACAYEMKKKLEDQGATVELK